MSKMLRRVLTVIPAAAVQALWILLLVKWLSPYAAYITLALSVAAVLLVLLMTGDLVAIWSTAGTPISGLLRLAPP